MISYHDLIGYIHTGTSIYIHTNIYKSLWNQKIFLFIITNHSNQAI